MLGNSIEVIAGLVLLIWGADRFVHGAAAAARNFGVPPLLIGLTIVAFATSAPEILVSVVASLARRAGTGNRQRHRLEHRQHRARARLCRHYPPDSTPFNNAAARNAGIARRHPAEVSHCSSTRLSAASMGWSCSSGLVIVMIWLTRLGMRSAPTDPIRRGLRGRNPNDVSMNAARYLAARRPRYVCWSARACWSRAP